MQAGLIFIIELDPIDPINNRVKLRNTDTFRISPLKGLVHRRAIEAIITTEIDCIRDNPDLSYILERRKIRTKIIHQKGTLWTELKAFDKTRIARIISLQDTNSLPLRDEWNIELSNRASTSVLPAGQTLTVALYSVRGSWVVIEQIVKRDLTI